MVLFFVLSDVTTTCALCTSHLTAEILNSFFN